MTILVLDVNDNAPVFQRRDYSVTVPEDVAIGTEVIRVLATSADIGPNAEITYSIRSGNELGKFSIDRNLGKHYGEWYFKSFHKMTMTINISNMQFPPLICLGECKYFYLLGQCVRPRLCFCS